MNKWLVPILALILLPAPFAWAQGHDSGGNGNGDSSGYGNGKGKGGGKGKRAGGNAGKKWGNPGPGGRKGNPRNKGTFNSGSHPQGAVKNPGAPHHFNTAGGSTFHNNGGNFHPSTHPSPRLQKMGINKLPPTFHSSSQIMNTPPQHSLCEPPKQGPGGASLPTKPLEPRGANQAVIQNHMNTFAQNTAFTGQVNLYNNRETVANHYYWHTWNGANYCHYYDNWGYHWYGWYWGGHCFWSRWWGAHWWWYDPVYFHWCYWSNGWWWWQDPANVTVVYVYNNGQYVPANSADTTITTTTTVMNPSPSGSAAPAGAGNPPAPETADNSTAGISEPAATGPIDPATTASYPSKDGTRTVKVVSGDAFLYDTAAGETDNKPVFLASGVKQVKYSNPHNGKSMQVMLVMNDGSFELFDADGNPSGGQNNDPGN